jgi:hypothetical protein
MLIFHCLLSVLIFCVGKICMKDGGLLLVSKSPRVNFHSLLEILSFATSHYATGMQLIVICNYLGHICNYKFGIVSILGHTVVCATNMQLNVYNMDMCHTNNGLNLYIFKLLYLIYLHRLYIIVLCTSSIKVNPMLT